MTKFGYSSAKIEEVVAAMSDDAEIVSTRETLSVVVDDPDDDRVLECAVAGQAGYIVTGDKHLLRLGSYDGIEIVTVRQFMDVLIQKH